MLKRLRERYIGFIVAARYWLDLYKSRRAEEARLRDIAEHTGKTADWDKVRDMRAKKNKALRQFRRKRGAREEAERDYDREKKKTRRERAIEYAPTRLGLVENPPGSNRGGFITTMQKAFGDWLVGLAWCGVFAGYILRHVGVKVTYRVASVNNIVNDAKAGKHGFRKWRSNERDVEAGDLAVIFGPDVHVEFVLEVTATGCWTAGGNTSPGAGGSQSNGGGSYRRFRTWAEIYGIAVPDYPDGS